MLAQLQLEDFSILSLNLKTDERSVLDAPSGMSGSQSAPQPPLVEVSSTVISGDAERVIMELGVRASNDAAAMPALKYSLDVKVLGTFWYGNVEEAHLDQMISFNAPSILYGVVRGIVAQMLAMTGVGKVTLPAVNFAEANEE